MMKQRKPKFTVKGINSDTDTCAECGKTNLKKVVWLVALNDEGDEISDPTPVGVDCAARMLGWSFGRKAVESKLNAMLIQDMENRVCAKISEIFKGMVVYQYTYFPIELANAVAKSQMTKMEAFKLRNEQFPILKYSAGEIKLDQALELI